MDLALARFPKGRELVDHPYRNNKNVSFTGGAEKPVRRSAAGAKARVGDFNFVVVSSRHLK
jgi:hypothetical protein